MLKKKLFLIFLLLALTSCSNGDNYLKSNDNSSNLFLAPFKVSALGEMARYKWGFINNKGKIIIDAKFEYAESFSEGLAKVCIEEDKCGFINQKGKYIVNPIFKDAHSYLNGYAAVKSNDGWGFIDKEGNIRIEPNNLPGYRNLDQLFFSDGYVLIQFEDPSGEKYNFMDEKGNLLLSEDAASALPFSEGLAYVKRNVDFIHEYIDKDGKTIINIENPDLLFCGMFSEGIAPCLDYSTGKIQYINKKGQFIFNTPMDWEIENFQEGYAFFNDLNTDSYGFINTKGEIVIEPQFIRASNFSEGFASVFNTDKSCGFINENGDFVIEPKYSGCCDFKNGLANVAAEEGSCYINKKGEIIWCEETYCYIFCDRSR